MSVKDDFNESITKLEKSGVSYDEAKELLSERYEEIETARAEAMTTVFVVKTAGDAPVQDSEIVTEDLHKELVVYFANSGYSAEPAKISVRNLDRLTAAAAAGK